MAYYLHINSPDGFEAAEPFDENLFTSGKTYEDYLNGERILLTKKQNAFRLANPGVSVKEIIEMKLIPPYEPPPPPTEPSLEEVKNAAIQRVEFEAEMKLNELYPVREVLEDLIALVIDSSDTEVLARVQAYISVRDDIRTEKENVCGRILAAIDVASAEMAVSDFAVTVRDVNLMRPTDKLKY